MKSLVFKIQLLVAAALVSGCSTLDMRCDDVSDRVTMHAGEKWFAYSDISVPQAEARTKQAEARARKMAVMANGVSDDDDYTILSTYCATKHRPRQSPVRESLHAASTPQSHANGAENAPPPRRAPEGNQCEWKGDRPAISEAKNSQEAKDRYLLGKEVFLSGEKITFSGQVPPVPITLINQSLNCVWDDPVLSAVWPCEKLRDIPVDYSRIASRDVDVFRACFDKRPTGMTTNLMGVVDHRYCLFLGLFEVKPVNAKADNDMEKDWYTNISHDRLKAELWCAEYDGPVQPGVVIGGPRADFRLPIFADSPTPAGPPAL